MTDNPQDFAKKAFFHTRKEFWGGSWYPYWTLMVATVFLGLVGGDHFWLRSPQTGIAKFLVNIFTFGLWWIYDMIQIFKDKDLVMKYGLTLPMTGPSGIGAGMFRDDDPNGPKSKSPFRFLFYLFLTCLPFGFDFFIAGDSNGALMRFLTSFIIFLWPIGFIWGCISMARGFLMPQSLFEKGTYRMFPVNWFMSTYGPSTLGPKDVPFRKDDCDPGGSQGLWRTLISILPISIQSAINTFFPAVTPAVQGVALATQATAAAVKAAANTASAGLQAGKEVLSTVAESAAPMGALLSAAPLPSAPLPSAPLSMKGGGSTTSSGIISDSAVVFLFLVVLGGSTMYGLSRLRERLNTPRNTNDPNKNDTPPSA